MDTSETYVKMCDCLEIQGQRGNLMHQHDYLIDCLWLPRQDQTQEMCEGSWWGGYCNMAYWAESKHFPYVIDEMHSGTLLKSMEQLWLAFYMHEKHQKTWDGEKWISVDNA